MKNLAKIEYKGITINPNHCQMFTNEGNKRVTTIIKKCIARVLKGTTNDGIQDYALDLVDKLSKNDKYGEAYDTEPRAAIQHYIEKAAKIAGVEFNNLYI